MQTPYEGGIIKQYALYNHNYYTVAVTKTWQHRRDCWSSWSRTSQAFQITLLQPGVSPVDGTNAYQYCWLLCFQATTLRSRLCSGCTRGHGSGNDQLSRHQASVLTACCTWSKIEWPRHSHKFMASRMQQGWMVPGCGLPIRWPDEAHYLPGVNKTLLASALDGTGKPWVRLSPWPFHRLVWQYSRYCYTVCERTMICWTNELTDMPD